MGSRPLQYETLTLRPHRVPIRWEADLCRDDPNSEVSNLGKDGVTETNSKLRIQQENQGAMGGSEWEPSLCTRLNIRGAELLSLWSTAQFFFFSSFRNCLNFTITFSSAPFPIIFKPISRKCKISKIYKNKPPKKSTTTSTLQTSCPSWLSLTV